MQTLCILGRQPSLGLAELENLFGADNLIPAGKEAVLLNVPPGDIPLARLGGTIKVCKLLTELPFTDWGKLVDYISEVLPEHLGYIPEGKIKFGMSVHGIRVSPAEINRTGLQIKKIIKSSGRSVRVVPNNEQALSSAQTIHNMLTGITGLELVFVARNSKTLLAQVTAVQDIAAYANRDQQRPKRDARVGMLPPKLAQIILNLAALPKAALQSNPNESQKTVLDPFCGTGVLLQEALLMGYDVLGSDIETRMIDYSKENLMWLRKLYADLPGLVALHPGDATTYNWPKDIAFLAAETYLGRPFSAPPRADILQEVIQDVNTIHKKFLRNLASQTSKGFRLCLAVPSWKKSFSARASRESTRQDAYEQRTEPYIRYGEGVPKTATQHRAASKSRVSSSARDQTFETDGFWHLPSLDSLEELGYTRLSFVHVENKDLIYYRDGQIVARELVVLQRN